jgi:acyl-[acyl carrier protein]--UDP-N-acetylglucosamine O-acyltransferase
VTFNVQRRDRSPVGHVEVGTMARLADVALRVGCFCNVGAVCLFVTLDSVAVDTDFWFFHQHSVNIILERRKTILKQ